MQPRFPSGVLQLICHVVAALYPAAHGQLLLERRYELTTIEALHEIV